MEALHHPHASGFSLYDCITNYLSIQGDELSIDFSLFPSITKNQLTDFCENIQELDTVFQITGHPQDHPLKELEPYKALKNYKPASGALLIYSPRLPLTESCFQIVWESRYLIIGMGSTG